MSCVVSLRPFFLQKPFRVDHEIPVDPVMLGFFIADFFHRDRVEAEDLRLRAGQDDRGMGRDNKLGIA